MKLNFINTLFMLLVVTIISSCMSGGKELRIGEGERRKSLGKAAEYEAEGNKEIKNAAAHGLRTETNARSRDDGYMAKKRGQVYDALKTAVEADPSNIKHAPEILRAEAEFTRAQGERSRDTNEGVASITTTSQPRQPRALVFTGRTGKLYAYPYGRKYRYGRRYLRRGALIVNLQDAGVSNADIEAGLNLGYKL